MDGEGHKGAAIACGFILVSILIFILILWYAYWATERFLPNALATAAAASNTEPAAGTPNPDVPNSIPVFVYCASDENKLECSVCLGEFKDREQGRMLPICRHSFHVQCIDPWLEFHPTCPLCRSNVFESQHHRGSWPCVAVRVEP